MIKFFSKIWRDHYLKFILSFIVLSILFYAFNDLFIGATAKGGVYIPFLDEHLNYIKWWRHFTIESTATVLRWMGHTVITNEYQLRVIGRAGFTLVYSCLGYGIMGIFAAFTLSYPKPFKKKIIFLIFGLVLIQILNITRLVLLSLFWKRNAYNLPIDHHDLFNLIVYLILILTTYLWIKVSKDQTTETTKPVKF